MQKLLFVILLVSVVFSSFALAQTKTVTTTFPKRERVRNSLYEGKPERAFEDREHRLSDATRLADKVVLEELLGSRLMILGLQHTKSQWIDMVVRGKGSFVSIEKSVLQIQMFGDTVVTTGTQYVNTQTENGGRSYQFGFMHTWIRSKNGEWECVALASDQIR